MTKAENVFIDKLDKISTSIAIWAAHKIGVDKWSIEDVKINIKNAAKAC